MKKKSDPKTLEILAAMGCENGPSALRAAGWTPSALRAAGWTPSDLIEAEKEWEAIPILSNPYSELLDAIRKGSRLHDQSTFGPDADPETNLCKTRMCTAGHLVNMAGKAGYALKEKYGDFVTAARLIHLKSRPDVPPPYFGSVPQEIALAYIEKRAEEEKTDKDRIAAN